MSITSFNALANRSCSTKAPVISPIQHLLGAGFAFSGLLILEGPSATLSGAIMTFQLGPGPVRDSWERGLFGIFRVSLWEICDQPSKFCDCGLKDDEDREKFLPESVALQGIRLWRSQHRKKMVDSIERLIEQAEKNATSQYTRSNQRARWTRLAGQLIWYKDQILRSMTWEALEQDVSRMARRVVQSEMRQKRQVLTRPWTPTIVKKKDQESREPDEASKETASA